MDMEPWMHLSFEVHVLAFPKLSIQNFLAYLFMIVIYFDNFNEIILL